MHIDELSKRLKPIFLEVCGNRFDVSKCLWQMGLTEDECLTLACLIDNEFHTKFIDMDLTLFQAMGFCNISVYINRH